MSNQPLISVIVPSYNVQDYIVEALDSICAQTYLNIEVLVINDGSTDGTADIVSDYIKGRDSCGKVKLITQKNSGVSAARNRGIKEANGKYVCFIDADDIINEDFLSVMHANIARSSADVAVCRFDVFKDGDDFPRSVSNDNNRVVKGDDALRLYLYGKMKTGCWSLLCSRQLLLDNGLEYQVGSRYSEDIHFIYRLLACAKKVVIVDAKLYCYRIRSSSVMSVFDPKRDDGYKLINDLVTFFKKRGGSFAVEYAKFGVARWVWASLWQAAAASDNFKDFRNIADRYDARKNMKRLYQFPSLKIKCTSRIFRISPRFYFHLARLYAAMVNRREFKNV